MSSASSEGAERSAPRSSCAPAVSGEAFEEVLVHGPRSCVVLHAALEAIEPQAALLLQRGREAHSLLRRQVQHADRLGYMPRAREGK